MIAEHGRDGALSALWTMHCADADAASGPASAETLTLDAPLDELLARVRLGDGRLWVHLDATNPAQHALLATHFGFHPLAIEDTLNPATRVKVEEYDGYLFAVVRGVSLNETTDDPYDLATHDLHAFLLPRVLVTVSAGPHPSVLEIRSRVQRSPDVLGRGLDRLLHALLDDIIDRYFPLLDRIDEFVDDVEERVFV
ncbi:MAG: hypothetical protein MUD17_13995, partial [Gemmatimonadaceae bacterium]|nr:hypothetical protein [Gemmatimonadaceae bacterium]